MVTMARLAGGSEGKQRRLLLEKALAAAKAGQWEDAVEANTTILADNPGAVDAHNRLGKALSELGRYREAHAAYSRANELEPLNIVAQRNLDRLSILKEIESEEREASKSVPAHTFIEETGRTTTASLVRPADGTVRARLLPGDELEVRIDATGSFVALHARDGNYVGELEARVAERIIRLTRDGNRYTAAVIEHEIDTLRVILREVFQDPSLADQLSFPARVRGAAPRAYIRRDIVAEGDDEIEVGLEGDDDEVEAEEVEEEPEVEDEEFGHEDDTDTGL